MHPLPLPLLVLALSGCLLGGLPAQEKKGATLSKFEFAGTTLGGAKLDQSAFADNVVIVDLWGTWCPPCRKAVPELVKLYEKYKQHGLEVVGLCYAGNGDSEDADKVRKFAAENRITYTLLPGTKEMRSQIPGFSGYPTLLMFEKGMKHKATHVGFSEGMGEEMETWVRGALGLDAPAGGDTAKDGKGIQITEPAMNQLAALMQQQGEAKVLRVGVRSGGCSGMSYTMDFIDAAEIQPDDERYEYEPAGAPAFSVVSDPKSLLYI
mgnify:CR=1 FL=1